MEKTFREAFISHLEKTGTKVSELARAAGVSKDMLNKLKQGSTKSINVDDAVKVAAYFGQNLNDFIGETRAQKITEFQRLLAQLDDHQRDFFFSQLEGAVRSIDRSSSENDVESG